LYFVQITVSKREHKTDTEWSKNLPKATEFHASSLLLSKTISLVCRRRRQTDRQRRRI